MPKVPQNAVLSVKNIGPISSAHIELGHLTVLVGPQASGKSVLLQTLKLLLDTAAIDGTLRRQGYTWAKLDRSAFLYLFFGDGLEALWSKRTRVTWAGKATSVTSLMSARVRGDAKPALFYIPAQRVLTLKNGWPRNFSDYNHGDPYVVKDFSEQLRLLMDGLGRGGEAVFPQPGRLSEATQELLKQGIFGDFELRQESSGLQNRLVLAGKGEMLPFMVWSAGQREFSPLLLGLYHLLPAGGTTRREKIRWVVLEEPEMGLHPRAITAVLFLVLELMNRGYRVCISTHSPQVLDLMWALRVFQEGKAPPEVVLRLFDVSSSPKNEQIAKQVLTKKLKVYSFSRDGRPVMDISRLDPDSSRPEEINWGGLTEFSATAADVVADFIANSPRSRRR